MKSLMVRSTKTCFLVIDCPTFFQGFDDQGRQYDSDGNLVDWWEETTKKAYLEKARCIIEQYGNYTEPNVDLKLNGINTQGENIADNGGVLMAYRAYQKWVESNGVEETLPGLDFNPNQLFWISLAQTWCSVYRLGELLLVFVSSRIYNVFDFFRGTKIENHNRSSFDRTFQDHWTIEQHCRIC